MMGTHPRMPLQLTVTCRSLAVGTHAVLRPGMCGCGQDRSSDVRQHSYAGPWELLAKDTSGCTACDLCKAPRYDVAAVLDWR